MLLSNGANMKLYKNTEWKEVGLNNKIKQKPVDWSVNNLSKEIIDYKPSKLNASCGKEKGKFIFFNASEKQTMFSDVCLIDGEAVIITTGGDFAFAQYYYGKFAYSSHVWCFKLSSIHNKFFTYLFKYFFEDIQNLSVKGFKLKNLSKKDFKAIDFWFPPAKEQSAIASILSHQEAIISKTKELIAQLEQRNQFMLDELLSGRLRVKEEKGQLVLYKNPVDNWQTLEINGEDEQVPSDWDVEKIQSVIDIIFGKRITKSKSSGYIPVYGGGGASFFTNISNQSNKWVLGRFAISENCVRYIKGDFWLLDSGFTFTIKENNNESFFGLKMILFQKYIYNVLARGGAQKNIDIDNFKNADIFIPKMNEQNLIVKCINSLIQEKEKYEQLLIQEQKTFDFLLEELMSGRLRIEVPKEDLKEQMENQ